MFVALYEMVAKPGRETEFETAWAAVTEAILRVRGSWGSRLHTTKSPRTYIAYAQWPSEDVFDRAPAESSFTKEESQAFVRMKDAAESIRLLHRLDVHFDLLKDIKR